MGYPGTIQVNGAARPVGSLDELTAGWDRLVQAVRDESSHVRFTLHLDFTVDDRCGARDVAVKLATALGILRPETEPYSARLSTGERWAEAQRVFCTAEGPHGAFCAYPSGHDGWHAEAGVDGLRWGDGDKGGTRG